MLKELLRGRGAFLELLAAALVLALGVNILATALLGSLDLPRGFQFLLAVLLITLPLLSIARKAVRASHVSRSMRGVLVYVKDKNELISIPRYELSEAIGGYLESLFSENKAMKKLWADDPLSKQLDVDANTGKVTYRRTEAANLLQEAIEYFVLHRLSTHLTDYFNKPPFDNTRLREFVREDVPTVLFKNRFLDTFSRSMTERPAFIESEIKYPPIIGRIVASFGPGSIRYERFDLVLPQCSRVGRTSSGTIEIVTPKFSLNLECIFEGSGAVLPSSFVRMYLRRNDFRKLSTFGVKIVVSVRFKHLSLLTQAGWEYHMWLDSFMGSLESMVSSTGFLREISWESARTVIELMDGVRKLEHARHADDGPAAQQ